MQYLRRVPFEHKLSLKDNFTRSLYLTYCNLCVLQTTFNTSSPTNLDRFQSASFDVNVCSPGSMATDVNTYQTSYQATPVHSFAESAFSGSETSIDTFGAGGGGSGSGGGGSGSGGGSGGGGGGSSFENLTSSMAANYTEISSSLPSFPETYNIHGTYAYMREDTKPEFTSFTSRDSGSPGSVGENKYSATMHYQSQYEAFSEENYIKQQGAFSAVESHEFYQKGAPTPFQGASFPSASNMAGYNPEQKDVVYPHQTGSYPVGNQQLFPGAERGQAYQAYQPGFYDNQRLGGSDSNFNYAPPGGLYPGDLGVQMGLGPYQRRPSMSMASPETR